MSSTIDPVLRPTDKRHQAHIEAAYGAGLAPDAVAKVHLWRRNIRIGDFTGAAATSQEINLFTGLTTAALARAGQSGDFPANCWINVMPSYLRRITDFSGGAVSAATIEFGDTNDPNGLLTATNVFTAAGAGIVITSAALEYAARPETAFAPTLTIRTTTANVSVLTAGECEVVIPYTMFAREIR